MKLLKLLKSIVVKCCYRQGLRHEFESGGGGGGGGKATKGKGDAVSLFTTALKLLAS